MLVEVTERAMAHTQKNELILTGGVAASPRLREMCDIMCRERGARFIPVELKYSGDNGAMIAWTGILAKSQATKKYDTVDIKPRWRTDEAEVDWK
jgi:tRNA A37 threonylcarbamoyltransferase TsaD